MRNLNLLFAWRYFKAKKSTNAINIIAWVSVAAVLVGTAALIIVLSVFNGLEDLVKSLYSSFYPQIKVTPSEGKFLTLNPAQLHQLSGQHALLGYSLVVEDKALLQYNEMQPAILKGVDAHYKDLMGLPQKVVKGTFDLGTVDQPGVVLGVTIENALGIESDKSLVPLDVYTFKKTQEPLGADPMGSLSASKIAPTGAFAIQNDFDSKYAITNLGFVKAMLGLGPDQYSGVEIQLRDPRQTDEVRDQLQQLLGSQYRVQTRYQQNQDLYKVMSMEKWVIYAVLTLILAVAAFNMVGALTMLVLEKQKDIQVLKAMGATSGTIQRIFLSEGLLLGCMGGALGMLLALGICWLQVHFKLVPLQGDSFLIDYYPVKLLATDFFLVGGTILLVAWLASWLPARKAAAQPIELRS